MVPRINYTTNLFSKPSNRGLKDMNKVLLQASSLSTQEYKFIKPKTNKALPCDLNPAQCQNGGTCSNDLNGDYSCSCENGYRGFNCETRKLKDTSIGFLGKIILLSKHLILKSLAMHSHTAMPKQWRLH